MKPFDLEKALAGEKVITRDGREVTQITKFDCDNEYKVYAVVDSEVESYKENGSYGDAIEWSSCDLFMAPTKLSGFINVYKSGATGVVCKTKEEADDRAGIGRIACIDLSQFEKGHGL